MYDGLGGAVAAVVTEGVLAVLVYWFLARADRDVLPRLRFLPRPSSPPSPGRWSRCCR